MRRSLPYANYPLVILVNKDLPVSNLTELATHAAKNPKSLSYGTTGVGSGGHFLFELYKSMVKLPDASLPPVHFAGIAPELTALVGNHIQVAIMPLTSLAAQQIDAGSSERDPLEKSAALALELLVDAFAELLGLDLRFFRHTSEYRCCRQGEDATAMAASLWPNAGPRKSS